MRLPTIEKYTHVAVCVPCRDTLHSMFAHNLVQTIQHCAAVGIKTTLLMETGSLIANQRQNLARSAISINASHIMWLDSDMLFPVDAVEKLLASNFDIVACNYSTRSTPIKGVAYTKLGDWDSWLGFNIAGDRFSEVEGVGMGCMLTKTSVFAKLDIPWFDVRWNHDMSEYIGEDFYFCTKAAAAGYKIMIDNHLSRDVKHLGTTGFRLIEAVRR